MRALMWLGVAFAGVLTLGAIFAGLDGAGPAAATDPPLELLAATSRRSSSAYMRVEGQVKNHTGQPLRNVSAVVSWYSPSGQFVTSERALIEYNPLLPGQTSPFNVLSRYNPELSRFTVEFAQLGGGTLAHTGTPK